MKRPSTDRQVLVTKLYPPSAGHAALLSRDLPTRLRGASPRLYLLQAPAGAGKTSLLRQLWNSRQPSAAWLSLDNADNDLHRFLAHLVAAVAVVDAAVATEAQAILRAGEQIQVDMVTAALINALAEHGKPFLLCLDDFHEIHSLRIVQLIAELLRFLPAEVGLAIATRHEPALPLGQLRARGAVLDVAWNELHFTPAEAVAFLTQVRHLPLTTEQAARLAAQTEGWPAGLQLVAAALERGVPAATVLSDKSGSETRLRDFLLESVWDAQTAQAREFLMDTALLDRFCQPLCDAIGCSGSLTRLLQENLFVFQLHGDQDIGWYRYHQLFREFLLSRRNAGDTDRQRILVAAARWCAARSYPREALDYAMRAEAYDFAADWLQQMGRPWLLLSDTCELSNAIGRLPEDQLAQRPALCLLHAWALLYLGELAAASARLDRFEQLAGVSQAARAEAAVLRVILGVVRADEPELSEWRPTVLDELARDDIEVLAFGYAAQGYVERTAGRLAAAADYFSRAEVLTVSGANHSAHLLAAYNSVLLKAAAGDLLAAEGHAREVLEVIDANRWQHVSGAGFVYGSLAIVLYEQYRLHDALVAIESAIEILSANQTFSYLGVALSERARIHFALGDEDQARGDLRAARRIGREHRIQRAELRADLVEILAELRAGNLKAAQARAAATRFPAVPESGPVNERHDALLIESIYLQLAGGQCDEVLLSRIETGLASAMAAGRRKSGAELHLQLAAILHRLGRLNEAQSHLAAARAIAEPGGFNRLLSVPMPGTDQLLAQVNTVSSLPAPNDRHKPPRFRQRELQILRLVAQGLANREIGERLFISETTVKWYLKHLFQMLEVNNRTAAIAKARQLDAPGV